MASSKKESEGNHGQGGKGGNITQAQLEAAQRIARETLEADYRALELDARMAFRSAGGA